VYRTLDNNGKGYIDTDDLIRVYQETTAGTGFENTHKEAREMIEKLKVLDNDKLTLDEYYTIFDP